MRRLVRVRNALQLALGAGLCGALLVACAAPTASDGHAPLTGAPASASGSGGQDAASAGMPAAGSSAPAPPHAGGASGTSGDQGPAGSGTAGSAPTAGSASGDAGAGSSAGTGGAAGDTGQPVAGASAARLPPVTAVDADGPFTTSQDLATGPSGDSGLYYPTPLGKDGLEHPIFVWGCGGGSTPASYAMHLNRIASHGFVVIAAVSNIGDDAEVLSANLDWLLAENERAGSMLEGMLDTRAIAAGGHSIGSVNAFLFAPDPRLRTTIHVAGGSLDDVNDPFAMTTGLGGKSLVHPTALICSESDVFGNVEKTEADYAAATAPVFFTVISGAEHVTVTDDALPAIVAWLRWQLGGETERSQMFLDDAGEFHSGRYVSKTKNW